MPDVKPSPVRCREPPWRGWRPLAWSIRRSGCREAPVQVAVHFRLKANWSQSPEVRLTGSADGAAAKEERVRGPNPIWLRQPSGFSCRWDFQHVLHPTAPGPGNRRPRFSVHRVSGGDRGHAWLHLLGNHLLPDAAHTRTRQLGE